MTINEGMVLQKAVNGRLNELRKLRDSVSTDRNTYTMYGEKEKREEIVVKYDIKLVDKKVVELEIFLFKLDSKIKQANAMTKIDLEANIDALLSPLE